MTDLFSKFDPLIEQRAALLSTGVTDPFSLVMEKVLSPTVAICNGRETILLGTYNYMGMTFDPDVIAAFARLSGKVAGNPVAASVCYEILFPQEVRAGAAAGAVVHVDAAVLQVERADVVGLLHARVTTGMSRKRP